ncbi:MAG TPA: hypothetical protein VGU72_25595 [Beijerinckiaceae bacterium]|jgi:hypothetical protein|nr:hypothetical protein [Beijerinckiaceae bacterium]
MDKNNPLGGAAEWVGAVERIGLASSLLLILFLGFSLCLIFRGPGMLVGLNSILGTILQYRHLRAETARKAAEGKQKSQIAFNKRAGKIRRIKGLRP